MLVHSITLFSAVLCLFKVDTLFPDLTVNPWASMTNIKSKSAKIVILCQFPYGDEARTWVGWDDPRQRNREEVGAIRSFRSTMGVLEMKICIFSILTIVVLLSTQCYCFRSVLSGRAVSFLRMSLDDSTQQSKLPFSAPKVKAKLAEGTLLSRETTVPPGDFDFYDWPLEKRKPGQIDLLYDGDCPICMMEVNFLEKRDIKGLIKFTNLRDPGYNPGDHGNVTFESGMRKLRAVLPDGTVKVGVEVFRETYKAIGLGWMFALTNLPLIGNIADQIYDIWAENRLRLTGKGELADILAARAAELKDMDDIDDCEDSCDIDWDDMP